MRISGSRLQEARAIDGQGQARWSTNPDRNGSGRSLVLPVWLWDERAREHRRARVGCAAAQALLELKPRQLERAVETGELVEIEL